MSEADVRKILAAKGVTAPVAILGVRGFYPDMARPNVNDRGVWDDALFVVGPVGRYFKSFNGNTDPSIERKGVAVLKPGTWRYRPGKHKITSPNGYPAFVQAAEVTVVRDGEGDDTGMFGINIHHGGNGTSSLGCQTIVLPQWDEFRDAVYTLLREFELKEVPYLLVTEESRRKILGLAPLAVVSPK